MTKLHKHVTSTLKGLKELTCNSSIASIVKTTVTMGLNGDKKMWTGALGARLRTKYKGTHFYLLI